MIMGMALSRVSAPPATNPTTIEVVVEELCMRLVDTTPIMSPAKGLDVIWIKVSAKPVPNSLKECPSNLILSRNTYRVRMIDKLFKIFDFNSESTQASTTGF
jgi:hypothetical protein